MTGRLGIFWWNIRKRGSQVVFAILFRNEVSIRHFIMYEYRLGLDKYFSRPHGIMVRFDQNGTYIHHFGGTIS